MQIQILIILLFFMLSIYVLINEEDDVIKQHKMKIDDEISEKIILLKYRYKSRNYYVSVSEHNKGLILTDVINDATGFKIIPISKKKFVLQNSETELLLNLIFTKFYNNEYDVIVSGTHIKNNTSQIRILQYKNKFYIKFYNGYYLSLSNKGILYASKSKDAIFYFKFHT